jgi:rhodanese-related sulfurtransferase
VQLRDGVVKNVMAKDVQGLVSDGWTILDVRPPNETKKVHVKDAIEVRSCTSEAHMHV